MHDTMRQIKIDIINLRSEEFLVATAGYARSVFSPQQSMKLSDGISSFFYYSGAYYPYVIMYDISTKWVFLAIIWAIIIIILDDE